MKKLSFVLLLITSFTTIVYANTTKPWWITIGTGVVYGNDINDNCARTYPSMVEDRCRNIRSNDFWNFDNFTLSYNLMPKPHQLLSANYVSANYNKFESSNAAGIIKETGYIDAISIEYGLIRQWQFGYLSGTIGPAVINSRSAHNSKELYPSSSHTGVGLSGKLEASVRPFRHIGFALTLLGNYNGKIPYYGVFLSLQFGKFMINKE